MTLPSTAKDRKVVPIATGCVDYFPDALAEVAAVSYVGNEQHNPGQPLHWDRAKSTDEADALMRHFVERGTRDADGARHSAKVAWRALALLQKEIERDKLVIDPKVVAAAEECYAPSGPGRISRHVADISDGGICVVCRVTREQAAILGHEFF